MPTVSDPMYGYESWTIKKVECWRIDAFELWCWRKLLRVPWNSRRSNQSILKEINPEYSLEELLLKLKLQYFGQVMWRADLLNKTLMLGKIEGRRRRGQQRTEMVGWHHWLDGHEFEQTLEDGEGRGSPACCRSRTCRVGHDSNWTITTTMPGFLSPGTTYYLLALLEEMSATCWQKKCCLSFQ